MRVAIAAAGPGLDAQAVGIFGRAPYFVIVDVDGENVKLVESVQNPGVYQPRGAGITAAQLIAGKGINAVIAGSTGPNAFAVLQAAGIPIYMAIPGTVQDNALALAQGRLARISAPAGRYGGGWGSGRGGGWGRGRW